MDEGSCTCQDNRATSSEIAMTSGEACDGEQMLFEPNRMCLRVSSTQIKLFNPSATDITYPPCDLFANAKSHCLYHVHVSRTDSSLLDWCGIAHAQLQTHSQALSGGQQK